jgi:hypothetical protein
VRFDLIQRDCVLAEEMTLQLLTKADKPTDTLGPSAMKERGIVGDVVTHGSSTL